MNAIAEADTAPLQSAAAELERHIDTIDEVYDFMLAYAAQGPRDERRAPGEGIRHVLRRMDAALQPLVECAAGVCGERGIVDESSTILDVLADDARKARALVRFVLGRENISSQLVDSLNASVHLRALLTDLFVLDEAFNNPPDRHADGTWPMTA